MVRVLVLLTFLFISAWAIPLANAATATCPSSGTYATLMGLNTAGGCSIDNLLFSNFTFASTATGGATTVAPSEQVQIGNWLAIERRDQTHPRHR